MTKRELGTLFFGLAGLLIVSRALPTLIDLVVRNFDQPDLLIGQVLTLVLGVMVWFNGDWIARKMLPDSATESVVSLGDNEGLFEIAVRLVGLWLAFVRGFPSAMYTIVNLTAVQTDFGSPNRFITWWHLVPDLLVIAFGLWLLVAPNRIVRWAIRPPVKSRNTQNPDS